VSRTENLLRAIRHDRPQWVPNGMDAVTTIGSPVVERPAQAGKDAFGVLWALEQGAHGGTYPAHGGQPVSDLRRWRAQGMLPDLDRLDWTPIRQRAAAVNRAEHLVCGFVEMGLFERTYLLLGMEEALMAYVTEPDVKMKVTV